MLWTIGVYALNRRSETSSRFPCISDLEEFSRSDDTNFSEWIPRQQLHDQLARHQWSHRPTYLMETQAHIYRRSHIHSYSARVYSNITILLQRLTLQFTIFMYIAIMLCEDFTRTYFEKYLLLFWCGAFNVTVSWNDVLSFHSGISDESKELNNL